MLLNKTGYEQKIKIFIPSTIDANKKIDSTYYINECLKILSLEFGGASVESIRGAWYSQKHGLIIEDIQAVYSYCEEITPENELKIMEFILKLKDELKQESIGIEYNNKMIFI
jgi:hypothetical protein